MLRAADGNMPSLPVRRKSVVYLDGTPLIKNP
jgi:hypothetical protein